MNDSFEIGPWKKGKRTDKDFPRDQRDQIISDFLEGMEAAGIYLYWPDPYEKIKPKTVKLYFAIRDVIERFRKDYKREPTDSEVTRDLQIEEGIEITREHVNRTRQEMRRLGWEV